MNVETETISPTRVKLVCSVTGDEYNAELDKTTAKYVKTGAVAGFRKGKAPKAAIVKQFGDKIESDTMNAVIRGKYEEAVKDNALDVYELLGIDDVKKEGGEMSFAATIDLVPKFELPKYDGIPVDSADTVVTDAEADEEFAKIRKSLASFVDFTPDTEAQVDDMVNLSFAGTLDGVPLAEAVADAEVYGAKENSWCTVGSKYYMVPGLPDALVGLKLGSGYAYSATFPDDHYKESLRGKTVNYTFTINSGRHLVLPEIDEEFLKKVNATSLETFMERIRDYLRDQAKANDKKRRVGQIYDYLLRATPFEVPQGELERSAENSLNRMIQYYMRSGMSREDLSEKRAELMNMARAESESSIRAAFIISAIGKELDVKLSGDEFNKFLANVFEYERLSDAQIKETINDRDKLRQLHTQATREKILDALYEKAAPTATLNAR